MSPFISIPFHLHHRPFISIALIFLVMNLDRALCDFCIAVVLALITVLTHRTAQTASIIDDVLANVRGARRSSMAVAA